MDTISNNSAPQKEDTQLIDKHTSSMFRAVAAVMVILSHYAEWYSLFFQTEGGAETFRIALTKLGVYGVDIFFLFSGYAMVKSLGEGRMSFNFVWKRIRNVYIPYFIIAGTIELVSGGFTSLHDFLLFASGYEYWYMNVLFALYIGFIVIYAAFRNKHIRVVLFCAFTYLYSYTLYNQDMLEFWYVSNIAFALGIISAEYEKYVKKLTDKAGVLLIAVLCVMMFFVTKSGLYGEITMSSYTKEELTWLKIGATLVWTLLVLVLTSNWRIKIKVLSFLGSASLYLYLTHTYIFMRCVNGLEIAVMARFAVSAGITVAVAILCRMVLARKPK